MCITNKKVKSNKLFGNRPETTITTPTDSVIMNEVRWAVKQYTQYNTDSTCSTVLTVHTAQY